ncbi:porin family protein [Filimonas effusa]|uniref:Outer membrane protein beta-barrel domain-containing protein n=1 Tax=Filimonas effusa TaxID=2508721 RepID=A0A4Q1D1W4_9BACT|nr:hypothetical protein [Filimonas effusa]RXK81774.1 hypothetical protein ESB13_18455 [Filimonas effusa]
MRDSLYNDDDLEAFLQQQVNKHRMYASDGVWHSIQDALHERRRWPALTFIFLFIISLLVVGTLLVKPEEHLRFIQRTPYLAAAPAPKVQIADSTVVPLAERLATGTTTEQTIAYARRRIQTGIVPVSVPVSNTQLASVITHFDVTANIVPELFPQPGLHNIPVFVPADDSVTQIALTGDDTLDPLGPLPALIPVLMQEPALLAQMPAREAASDDTTTAGDAFTPAEEAPLPEITVTKSRPGRWDFHLYVSPSASFRALVEEKNTKGPQYLSSPLAPNYLVDVNRVVRHTPARGFEIGFTVGYNLNPQFSLRAGLQYNMRQYNIEASGYSYELTRIALNGQDTISTYTPYRNIEGNYPIILHNRYHELSVPVGINWTGWRRGRWSWGVGTTVQPTYTFNKQPFIISSDFKNYANGAMLTRRWNLNTSFEMFLSYNTGNVRWQIGPQFRYQQFSSFKKEYPIKEYLLDYGIKFGITTPL